MIQFWQFGIYRNFLSAEIDQIENNITEKQNNVNLNKCLRCYGISFNRFKKLNKCRNRIEKQRKHIKETAEGYRMFFLYERNHDIKKGKKKRQKNILEKEEVVLRLELVMVLVKQQHSF